MMNEIAKFFVLNGYCVLFAILWFVAEGIKIQTQIQPT